jgi:hypothetical protein
MSSLLWFSPDPANYGTMSDDSEEALVENMARNAIGDRLSLRARQNSINYEYGYRAAVGLPQLLIMRRSWDVALFPRGE